MRPSRLLGEPSSNLIKCALFHLSCISHPIHTHDDLHKLMTTNDKREMKWKHENARHCTSDDSSKNIIYFSWKKVPREREIESDCEWDGDEKYLVVHMAGRFLCSLFARHEWEKGSRVESGNESDLNKS
jgi:hypothetical protein